MTLLPATAVSTPSRPRAETSASHFVQFYESEAFLATVVADFAAAGLDAGDAVLLVAMPEHRAAFLTELRSRGADVDRLVLLDARETLAAFLGDGMPQREAFLAHIGGLLDQLGEDVPAVRVYGEMVDLLWREGNAAGAVRLEQFWNELLTRKPFTLLCAYPMADFRSATHTRLFDEMCAQHARVVPTERYIAADADARALEISRLQQRAEALEWEIEQRTRLERERQRAAERNAFLLAATTVLNGSLDLESRMRELMKLAVPQMADGCAVDLTGDDGTFEHVSAGLLEGEILRVPMTAGARIIGTITFYGSQLTAEDELLARELGQRAAIAIENARLYRLAQEANRIKDEFLATLSHELRTPLTAILGWARIISLGGLDEATLKTAVETIEQSAQMQATLINDLLDVSKIVTGKLALHSSATDLAGVVRNAVQTVRLAAQARDVRIEVGPAPELLLVTGDPTRLQQIIWNLLANAIKFSHRGGGVTITLDRVDTAARIVVRDTGRGIAPEFLPHVFEPFRQADGSSTRAHGGLGLGLAIVKYLTELHGGSVRVESDGEGRGAAFTVVLPLAAG